MSKLFMLLCVAPFAVCATGCAELPKAKPFSLFTGKDNDDEENAQPRRMVVFWNAAQLDRPGRPSVRGFGGRIMFHGGSETPLEVKGRLVVYAYDEAKSKPEDGLPTRKFEFPADKLQTHLSTTQLGPSYSFWLPWDEVGGERTEVALIPYFMPEGGAVVGGETSRATLQGSTPLAKKNDRRDGSIRQVGFEEENGLGDGAAPSTRVQMETYTIGLPGDGRQSALIAGGMRPRSAAKPASNAAALNSYAAPNESAVRNNAAPSERSATGLNASSAPSPLTRSSRARFPARAEPVVRQPLDHGPSERLPAGRPSDRQSRFQPQVEYLPVDFD